MLRKQTSFRILLTLIFTVAIVGALEGGARLIRAKSGPVTRLEWLEYSKHIGWRSRPGSRSHAFAAERQFDGDGLFTVDSRGVTPEGRRGKRLILLLGDSRTFGNGVSTEETYGQVLERRLPGFEVINRAFPGYSSLQGLIALETDAPRFRPDIVVFAFDFNDRRYVLHPWEVDGKDQFQRLARLDSWDRLASSLALVELARGRRAPGPDHAEDRSLGLGTVRPRVSPSDFRQNLEAAARYCSEHGIELIFLILNDNIAESRDLEDGAHALRAGRLSAAEDMLRTPSSGTTSSRKPRGSSSRCCTSRRDDHTMRPPSGSVHGRFTPSPVDSRSCPVGITGRSSERWRQTPGRGSSMPVPRSTAIRRATSTSVISIVMATVSSPMCSPRHCFEILKRLTS